MANTTNLNLTKLAGTEKLKTFPSPYNENMEAIDAAFGAGFGMNGAPNVDVSINNLADGMAIIANGNTHAAVTSGQFVYVRNHGSLSEGLYTATANIAANGTLSGNNLTANTNGGLNALSGDIAKKVDIEPEGTITTVNATNLYGRKFLFGQNVTGLPDTTNYFYCLFYGSLQIAKRWGGNNSLFVRTYVNSVWQGWIEYKNSNWTLLTGIEENVAFAIPAEYTELMIDCVFAAGQHLTFVSGIPANDSVRQDMGFYYNATANGSGAITISTGRNLNIFHPYYAGTQTTYSSIKVYAR